MRNRYLLGLGLCALSIFSGVQAAAQASGFALDRLDVSERGSDWFTLESMDFRGHLRPAAGLLLNWAHKPLVVYAPDGSERTALGSDQLILNAGATLVA